MAVLELPLRSDQPHFDFVVSLDQVAYKFLFRWNTRAAQWFVSCSLEDDTPLFMGVAVVVNWGLGRRCKHPLRPAGALIAMDASGQQRDPGLSDLGKRIRIFYFDKAEVASLKLQMGAA